LALEVMCSCDVCWRRLGVFKKGFWQSRLDKCESVNQPREVQTREVKLESSYQYY
jgi:hypothetical protein